MIVVKLGGSVITYKGAEPKFRPDTASRLIEELTNQTDELIVVHGAGSFGHTRAKEHDISSGFSDIEQLRHVSLIHRDMRNLNEYIMSAMRSEGFRPVPIAPASIATNDNKVLVDLPLDNIQRFLELGMTPVTFGDVVTDKTLGFSILSGDDIIERIALELGAEKVIFVTNVDGIYTREPSHPEAELIERVDSVSLGKVKTWNMAIEDATGGMQRKTKVGLKLQEARIPTYIINGMEPDNLMHLLLGENVKGSCFYT